MNHDIMFSKTPDKLNRYIDPTGEFPNQELKLADWYVRHKLLLRKIFIDALMIWSVITLTYSFGYLVYFLVYGYGQDQSLYRDLSSSVNYADLQAAYKPQVLQIKNVEVFESAKDRYDFVALTYNPNERWLAKVTYKFKYNGLESESRQTILLPGEKRPIIYFGQKAESYPSGVQVVLEKIDWQNISRHEVDDVAQFMKEHQQFRFDDFKFTSAGAAGNLASGVQFTLYNDSAYGFVQPEFYVELRNDSGAQGYLYLTEDKFGRGEKRVADLRSMISNLDANDIAVYPVVNVFDPDVYLKG